MKFKLLTLAIATTAAIGGSFTAIADQNPNNTFFPAVSVPDASAYWTPERMRDAKELTMPSVSPNKIQKSPIVDEQVSGNDGADGAPPTVDIPPNNKQLFKPIVRSHDDSKTPSDAGTLNEHFSSTQLIPLTADTTYPYRAVGKLFFTIPGQGNYVCSASVLRQRIVITAGHCVHRGSGGTSGYYTNFLFVPAYRDGSAPFLQWSATYVQTTTAWATGAGGVPNSADYGMLEIQDKLINGVTQKIGAITGTFGYQLQSLMPNHLNLMGYPCNFDSCQKMHQVTAQSAKAVSPNNVEYGSDMGGGSSGGPWVQNFGKYSVGQTGGTNPGINRVVGVTSWGYTDSSLKAQGASNFSSTVFTPLLNAMCSHQVGNC